MTFLKSIFATTLLVGALTATAQTQPCQARITPIPFKTKHPSPPAEAKLSKETFIRFEYSLHDGYSLLLYSVPDDFPLEHYGDRGILLMHSGRIIKNITLRSLSVLRDAQDNYEALSVGTTCPGDGPVFFVAFAYRGDMTSPDLFIAVAPTSEGYRLTPVPTVYGGVLDLPKSAPLKIRTWSNLFEGGCNACLTRYEITEYQIEDGYPKKVKKYRTRKLYSSDDALFDDRLRIHISP